MGASDPRPDRGDRHERARLFLDDGADSFAEASRAAAKLAAEQAIHREGLPATNLRPNAFQNNQALIPAITGDHVYATPLVQHGVTLVDARDVAEIAAIELIRREQAADPLPVDTIEVVGPEAFTVSAWPRCGRIC